MTEHVDYPRGSVVLVPFPFTDLSGRKRRPALVVSPDEASFEEDLILCAITSRVPAQLSGWEVLLEVGNVVHQPLPKRSVVKVGKLFTMHRRLITARFGTTEEHKLEEVLEKLRTLFVARFTRPEQSSITLEGVTAEEAFRLKEIDEAVLALLHLNSFDERGQTRAWKTFDWDALDRLHEKDLIGDPKSKAKSVSFTEEGRRAAEEVFRRRFAR